MGRAPCCDKAGLKKGPWTPEEDQKLVAYIQRHGHGSWRALPKNAGLLRCGKSCRLRWTNYLRPDIKRGRFSLEEEQMIIQLHAILGNRWSAIAGHLAGRTDNEIKNYWNTHLKKRLMQMGIDPVTHKPRMEFFDPFLEAAVVAKPLATPSTTLSHMAQWENARLEAEARLAREYLRFAASSRGGHVVHAQEQQLQQQHGLDGAAAAAWNADARRQFGGEQQQQLWDVESSQPQLQFASDLASQLYASSSSRFDQSPTSTLCSLEGSSPSPSTPTMGGLLSGSSCDSGALFHEGVAAARGAFGEECDVGGGGPGGMFWSCHSKEELVIPGLSPASTIGDSELLNSSSSSSRQQQQQQDEGSPYTTSSGGLEMLFDPLVDAADGCKSEQQQQPPLAVLEWPDVGPAHSKDYWSNVLKLVGSPVSSA